MYKLRMKVHLMSEVIISNQPYWNYTTLPDGREKIAGLPFATEDQCSGLHYDKGKGQFYKKEATGNESTHQIQAF